MIYLDFPKAFDKISHKRLISKLRTHGIGELLCTWIEDWLSDRQQEVVLNCEVSDWQNVISGVPQGSGWEWHLTDTCDEVRWLAY